MRSTLIVTVSIFLIAIAACNKNEYDKTNLLKQATVEYIKNSSKNVETIKVKFNEPQLIKNKYLFIKYDRGFKLKINSLPDTIVFEKVKLPHLPYAEVKLMPQEKHDFKLLYFDSVQVSELTMKLNHPRRKKNTHLKSIAIINAKEFNKLFKKFPNFKTSDLPIIKVDLEASVTKKFEKGIVQVFDSGNGKNKLSQKPTYTGNCKIRIRGKSSSKFIKKGFKLTLTDTTERNISLLGMPKEHEWALHGPFKDISLFRNKFAYDLGRELGQYAPRAEFCELIVGNEYLGLYLLTETVKADKNRVAIKKNKVPNDTINSYIVKIDHGGKLLYTSQYKSKIDSGWGLYYKAVYPKLEKLTDFNKKLIIDDINDFEETLLSENGEWKNKINIESFVDYFIVNELTRNIDAYRLSTFMYKNIGDKLTLGPIWDFNYSLGLTNYNEGFNPEGWVLHGEAIPFWWQKLLENKAFKDLLVKRWFELRKNILSTENINNRLNKYTSEIEWAKWRNFERWYIYDNKLSVRQLEAGSYDEEIEYIKTWLKNRLVWIDDNIERL